MEKADILQHKDSIYKKGELVISELSIGNAKAPEYEPKGSEARRR
jgi:hypothetical protein